MSGGPETWPRPTPDNLQAWTLQQPYASAIALGANPDRRADGRWKNVENRPQRRALGLGGRWYGLHAGKVHAGWPESDPPWARSHLFPDGPLPLGAMLGAFHVARCVPYPDAADLPGLPLPDPHGLRDNPSAFGPWCYLVDRVLLLRAPVPCRGMNGSWPVARIGGAILAEVLCGLIAADAREAATRK